MGEQQIALKVFCQQLNGLIFLALRLIRGKMLPVDAHILSNWQGGEAHRDVISSLEPPSRKSEPRNSINISGIPTGIFSAPNSVAITNSVQFLRISIENLDGHFARGHSSAANTDALKTSYKKPLCRKLS